MELCHDVHERLSPSEAIRLARRLEPHRLFFLEDPLPPERLEWFQHLRGACGVPLAMGELFCNPAEWLPLVSRRLIDFIRVHLSAIGGITPARKLAEVFPGCPELRGGYACLNDRPGLGVDLDEAKAAGYPPCNEQPAWTLARLPDGITAKP